MNYLADPKLPYTPCPQERPIIGWSGKKPRWDRGDKMILLDLHRMNIGPDNVLSSERGWAESYPLFKLEADIRDYMPWIVKGLTQPQVKNKVKQARERVYNMFYNRKFEPTLGRGRVSSEHPDHWDDKDIWGAHSRTVLRNHPRRVGRIA